MPTMRSVTLLLIGSVLAGPALAQPAPPSPGAGDAVAAPTFQTDQAVGEFRASKMIGVNVYGPENQKVGDVNDVLLDATGSARAVVIGVGGFLGIGEKNVAVPWSALTWTNAGSAATATLGGAVPPPSVQSAPASTAGQPDRPRRSPDEQAAYNARPDHATTTLTKADLQKAPAFRYYAETHPQAAPAAPGLSPTGIAPTSPGAPAARP